MGPFSGVGNGPSSYPTISYCTCATGIHSFSSFSYFFVARPLGSQLSSTARIGFPRVGQCLSIRLPHVPSHSTFCEICTSHSCCKRHVLLSFLVSTVVVTPFKPSCLFRMHHSFDFFIIFLLRLFLFSCYPKGWLCGTAIARLAPIH